MVTTTWDRADQTTEWAIQRDLHVVLVHLYTGRATAPMTPLTAEKVARELGFTPGRSVSLIEMLRGAGLLRYSGFGEGLVLTASGVDYIEREAGRRRSLRLGD
ncbi:MAG: hypothetical protein WD737_14790 [Gemmatimonadota bacterium]